MERDKPLVLAVDDTVTNLDRIVKSLKEMADVVPVPGGEVALKFLEKQRPDLILLDLEMPGMNGFEVLDQIKAGEQLKGIPVIFLTAAEGMEKEITGLKKGAVDYIRKPIVSELVQARVSLHLELKRYQNHLEELVHERTKQLDLTQEVTIESLATLAESRDPETGGHIKRTQEYVLLLARCLMKRGYDPEKIDEEYIDFLAKSAPLHDIGKVGIPDAILLKPDKLNNEEFKIMKSHTLIGAATLREAQQKLGEHSFLEVAEELIVAHHEKWDGSGYPHGLAGEEIPIAGRIMALADVYDALVCKRVYKPPFSHTKTREILIKDSGTHFDPMIVDVFLEVEEQFREVGIRLADDEEEKEALRQ